MADAVTDVCGTDGMDDVVKVDLNHHPGASRLRSVERRGKEKQ
jgi:hypothetical protein